MINASFPTLVLSEKFSKVIRVFKEYILVEDADTGRDILDLCKFNDEGSTIFQYLYSLFELPDGKYTIVDTCNLTVSYRDFEIDSEYFS